MPTSVLKISEASIRRAARHHGQGFNLPLIAAQQAVAEAWVRTVRRAGFRTCANERSLAGYAAMSPHEFSGVNARQRWANWRTIPRNLDATCPDRPLMVLDLCCGIGDSTEVLAWHLPSGSRILGLEFQPAFVATARARRYRNRHGQAVPVAFVTQSVLAGFHDQDGAELQDGSVDLVNSSGAVGCHFRPPATWQLAQEVARVLRQDGVALIDAGRAGTDPSTLERIFSGLSFVRRRSARSCWLDRGSQLAFSRRA